jgi:hypothetical protein
LNVSTSAVTLVGIYANELTSKGIAENGLSQAVGAGEVGLDGSFKFLDDGEAALGFGDNIFLFFKWQAFAIPTPAAFPSTYNK